MQKRQMHLIIYYFDLFDIPDDILEICVASLLKKELWENQKFPSYTLEVNPVAFISKKHMCILKKIM